MGNEPTDDVEAPDERLLRGEHVDLVRAALDQLSVEHRTILVLREMEDYAYGDIAEVLAISIGTVRSRLSRARVQLRNALAAMQKPEE